jgi:4-diphosphocytidyl-2-C-methyl-D-erythritol kinase
VRCLHDLPAPAKLNLFLHVTGRRDDGYHLLQSVFCLIDWCDTLHIEWRHDGAISRSDIGATGLPQDDLCIRAARLLQQAAGVTAGAHITLEKQLPWGAGLGGGSSDAATTLLALNRLWGINWPRQRLAALAIQLGADVPFFIGGRNAWVEGIGERLTPIKLPGAIFVVLKPNVAVPTSAIFSSPLLRRDTHPVIVADFLADPNGFGRNDLQPCATSYSTQVDEALSMLTNEFGPSRMSGSGSAVFARVGQQPTLPSEAELSGKLQRLLATAPAGWTARLCNSLDAHPLVDWAAD